MLRSWPVLPSLHARQRARYILTGKYVQINGVTCRTILKNDLVGTIKSHPTSIPPAAGSRHPQACSMGAKESRMCPSFWLLVNDRIGARDTPSHGFFIALMRSAFATVETWSGTRSVFAQPDQDQFALALSGSRASSGTRQNGRRGVGTCRPRSGIVRHSSE